MTTQTSSIAISPEALAQLQAAAEHAASGRRDPEAVRAACERMDRMREELRRTRGEIEIAVDLIRDARDSA